MKHVSFLIAAIYLLIHISVAFAENEVLEDAQFQEARQAILDQNYVEAVKILHHVIENYPNHPIVLDHLAYSYLKLKMNDDAVVTYKKSIRASAGSSDVASKDIAKMYANLGLAYFQQNKNEEAAEAYQKAVKTAPDYAKAWQGLGQALVKLGDEEGALDAYQRSVEIEPNSPHTWFYLGNAFAQQGETNYTLNAYKKAVQFNPKYFEAWLALGELYLKLKRTQEANEAFEKASQLNPQNFSVWGNQKGARKESPQIEPYLKALQLKPQDVNSWHQLAQAYARERQMERAIIVYSRALWLWGGDLEDEENEKLVKNKQDIFRLLNELGGVYYASEKFKESIKTWQAAMNILTNNGKNKNPTDYGDQERLMYKMGLAYEKQKKFSDAISIYRKITDANPNFANAWKRLAEAYKQKGDKDQSKKAYRKYKKLIKTQE